MISSCPSIGGKGDPDRSVSLNIVVVTEGDERKPCLDLLDQVETLLDEAKVDHGSWHLSFGVETSSATLAPDGGGYVGAARFTIFALLD